MHSVILLLVSYSARKIPSRHRVRKNPGAQPHVLQLLPIATKSGVPSGSRTRKNRSACPRLGISSEWTLRYARLLYHRRTCLTGLVSPSSTTTRHCALEDSIYISPTDCLSMLQFFSVDSSMDPGIKCRLNTGSFDFSSPCRGSPSSSLDFLPAGAVLGEPRFLFFMYDWGGESSPPLLSVPRF